MLAPRPFYIEDVFYRLIRSKIEVCPVVALPCHTRRLCHLAAARLMRRRYPTLTDRVGVGAWQTIKLRDGSRITPNAQKRAEGYEQLRTAMKVRAAQHIPKLREMQQCWRMSD
jgi:hypothetical protein